MAHQDRGKAPLPIRPEHRHFYPIDWRELSNEIRFVRAKGRCESCDRPHASGDGRWFDEDCGRWRDGRGRLVRNRLPNPSQFADASLLGTTIVQLACAHLDQDTANNHDRNLAALCQRCHLDHDRPWNIQKRRLTVLLHARSAICLPDPTFDKDLKRSLTLSQSAVSHRPFRLASIQQSAYCVSPTSATTRLVHSSPSIVSSNAWFTASRSGLPYGNAIP